MITFLVSKYFLMIFPIQDHKKSNIILRAGQDKMKENELIQTIEIPTQLTQIFELDSDLSINELLRSLKFCPVQYQLTPITASKYQIFVENQDDFLIILNFIDDYQLRCLLQEKITPEVEHLVQGIIQYSLGVYYDPK